MGVEETSPATETQENLESTESTETTETTSSWFDTLHEDLKLEKTLSKFNTEDGHNKLAESYVNLEKRLGKSVIVPGDNATEKDVQDFRKKLGIPDSPDKYTLKYPEHEHIKVDETLDKEWRGLAHKIGLTPKQAQAMTEYEFERIDRAIRLQNENRQKAEDDLRKEFGNGYDDVVERANNTLRTFASEAQKEYVKEHYGNDPELIRIFAGIGAQMGEHTFKSGEGKTNRDTRDELLAKAHEQMLIANDFSKDEVTRKMADKEATRLFTLVYGDAEVSSSANVKLK
jgi:hypothetical protein